MTGFAWIHLSDWHQRGAEFNREVMQESMIRDIEERAENINSNLQKIEFVIFSGDLAYHGERKEYEAAEHHLLTPILRAAGLGKNRLFIVPGNHDLDWDTFKFLPADISQSPTSEEQMQEWMTGEEERIHLLRPFKDYRTFVESYTGQKSPDYACIQTFRIGARQISLLGLNSALMSGRFKRAGMDLDRGRLIVGEPQVHDSLKEITNADIRIAILHHPFDWLIDSDRILIERQIANVCHFVLHGHRHIAGLYVLNGTYGNYIVIPAGAGYDKRMPSDPHHISRYSFVYVNPDSGKGIAYLRRWFEERKEWGADITLCEKGEFPFDLPKQSRDVPQTKPSSIDVDTNVYRGWLGDKTNWIDIRGVSPGVVPQEAQLFSILDLYRELYTEAQTPNDEPIALKDLVAIKSFIIIIGDPGSGKTTFLNYLVSKYFIDLKK